MRKHETFAWGETRTYLVILAAIGLLLTVVSIKYYADQRELNGIMPDSSYVHSEIPKP